MKHGDPRPSTVGSVSGPENPFPLRLEGPVVKGFGRGSKELGIPTANIPISGLEVAGHSDLQSGVYFGYCSLTPKAPVNITSADAKTGEVVTSSASPMESTSAEPAQTLSPSSSPSKPRIYEMVMSIGWNPYYKNSKRSVEVHVLHDFEGRDFYGAWMHVLMLGFVREELDYVSKEALIDDIQTDIEVTRKSLEREKWKVWKESEWLRGE